MINSSGNTPLTVSLFERFYTNRHVSFSSLFKCVRVGGTWLSLGVWAVKSLGASALL